MKNRTLNQAIQIASARVKSNNEFKTDTDNAKVIGETHRLSAPLASAFVLGIVILQKNDENR